MRTVIMFCSVLTLAACASEDSTAPTISNLTYSPTSLPVGQASTISGTLAFSDPDGDLDQLAALVTLPDQSKQMLPMSDLQNVGTMTDGSLAWTMIVVPPVAGTYHMSLWLTDVDGH